MYIHSKYTRLHLYMLVNGLYMYPMSVFCSGRGTPVSLHEDRTLNCRGSECHGDVIPVLMPSEHTQTSEFIGRAVNPA